MNEAALKEHVVRVSQDQKHMSRKIEAIDVTLRGAGSDIGIVGRVTVMWRTWITLVYGAGAVCGYLARCWISS